MQADDFNKDNGKKVIDKAKKVLKATLKIFTKKWVIIAVALFLVIIALSGAYDALMDAFLDKVSKYTAEHPVQVQYDADDNSIVISDEQADELIEELEKMGFKLNSLHLSKDLIKKCYAAEVVSQELNRGAEEQEGKYYGRVYVKKASSTNSSTDEAIPLTYVPYEEMTGGKAKIDEPIANEQLQNGKDITECFSVSPEGKLVIANKVVNTDNNGNKPTSISLKELEYKSKITKYITPFEFLINLCVATQNPEYISALTDKIVKETSIVITIMDNVTTINTTRTYKYKNATSVDKEGRIYVKNSETGEYTDSGRRNPTRGNPQVTLPSQESDYISDTPSNSSIEIHNPTIQITEVDTWFVKQKITYNNQTNGPTENTSYEEIEDETPSHTDASYRYQYTTEDTSGTAEEVRMYISTITYKVNQMIEVITNTTINTYSEGVSETDEGSDAQGKTDEILEMLKTKYTLPLSMIKEAPIHKLVNGAGIFFQMLEKSSRTQELEKIMKYVLYLYNGKDYGVTSLDMSVFNITNFTNISGIGSVSAFGTNLSREEFIAAVQAYNGGKSYSKLSNAAGDFYDICTSAEYNVNPCLAFAWACIETGYGKSTPGNNLFGFAIYNGQSSGATYSSYGDSIRDFCGWVVNASTEGTDKYNYAYSTAQKYATVNSMFAGKPENNAYAMFCIYMYLGDTHLCNEPDFDNPAGIDYYQSHGSTWGSGGRIQIYSMYELGGISTGEYKIRCGHSGATDLTSLQEKADYAQYCFESRLRVAKTIFGNNCFLGEVGSIVEAAYMVADHFLNSGVEVHYAGNGVEGATNNGRTGVGYNIQASWDYPIENPSKYGIVCATFVSLSLWKAGLIDEATINQYPYNGCWGVENMLTQSSYANQWQKITSFAELQEGDIVFYPNRNHVYIYINGGKRLDQNYCVVSSSGDRSSMGKLLSADPNKFAVAYRYIGK